MPLTKVKRAGAVAQHIYSYLKCGIFWQTKTTTNTYSTTTTASKNIKHQGKQINNNMSALKKNNLNIFNTKKKLRR